MRETKNRGAGDERVSMWSVPRRFRRVYFPLFYFLGIIGIVWSVWYEASRLGSDASYHDIANAVIGKSPAILLLAEFISLMITEGSMVLAEMVGDYLQKRRERLEAAAIKKGLAEGLEKGLAAGREKGLAEGLAAGREKGLAEGRAQGEAARDSEWEVWFEGYRHAQENGLPFDEPPPSARSKNGTNDDEQPE